MISEYLRRDFRAICAVAALLLPSLAFSQAVVTSPPQDAARTAAYWTAARKAAARPMPLRSVTGGPAAAPVATVEASARTPIEVRGNLPAGAARNPSVAGLAEVGPAFGPGSTVWYNYPPPSTLSIPILDYIYVPLFPNTAVGKFFFSMGGGNFVCSAQSVTSAGSWGAGNRQTVVTAGHCCSDGAGNFASSALFEPAHLNGSAPLGSWPATGVTVYGAWHMSGDLSVDYCIVQMAPLGGQNINDAVGALGYAANAPLPQAYQATGWPAAPPFTGGFLYHSAASDAETDTTQAGLVPFTHGIGNHMTGGSSGGAWIKNYQSAIAGANNFFNGLNSYKYTTPSRPAEMFGPYIDTLFVNLLQGVATSTPAP